MKTIDILGLPLALRVSPTFLSKAACPASLRWSYIDKLKDQDIRLNAIRGQAVHAAVAEITRLALEKQTTLGREVRLDKDFSIADVRGIVTKFTPHEAYSELGHIFRWVCLWRERYQISPKIVGFEERMALDESFEETEWETASYRGIVDVIDIHGKRAVVTDYKSQPNILSQQALDNHDQMSFYCWLVSKFYPQIERYTARIFYLQYGFYAETERTAADIALYEQKMLMQVDKIQAIASWDPLPGEHCHLCDYVHLCPVGQDSSTLPTQALTEEQARRVAGEIRVKDEWLKRAKKKLKLYSEHNGAIETGGGYRFAFKPTFGFSWDPSLLESVLRDQQIPLTSIMAVDGKKAAKLLKTAKRESPIFADRLLAARSPKVTTTFKGYIPKGDDDDAGAQDDDGDSE